MSHLAGPIRFTLPRRVCVPDAGLRDTVANAIGRWNAMRPGLFELTDDAAAEVQVLRGGERTWVLMPLASPESILHWAGDLPDAWMVHELGHTLGLADHVLAVGPGYINARPADADPYRGVMCNWTPMAFSADDMDMVAEHFPLIAVGGQAAETLTHASRLPMVAGD